MVYSVHRRRRLKRSTSIPVPQGAGDPGNPGNDPPLPPLKIIEIGINETRRF
jgi:hypothetical protein